MKCRILLIDMDEHSRTILARRLTRRGFEVCTMIDPTEVIAEVASLSPDVILMDLSIATPDAWQTARVLKSRPDTVHIPIVAISVLDLPWDEQQALEAGCDIYLPKPLDMDMLGQILGRVSDAKCMPIEQK